MQQAKLPLRGAIRMALWKVPVISQSSGYLCWEACARMMWKWRFNKLDGYTQKAGAYAKVDKGLSEDEMDKFYKVLGLRSLKGPKGADIQASLESSPVIVTSIEELDGHACVMAGFNNGKYIEVNPCALETVDFETNSMKCDAKTLKLQPSNVEKSLGHYIWFW